MAQNPPALVSDLFAPRHLVKTNLAGYALLTVSANYETKLGRKTTAGLLGGYKLPRTIRVEGLATIDGERQTYTGDIRPEGWFVNPYFRFYPREAFKGFYVEVFTRYYDYTFKLPYEYEKNGGIINAETDGTANGMGGGLGLGVQFNLAPRVYLDLNIGYGVGVGNAHIETNDPNLEREDYETIKRNIEKHEKDADVRFLVVGNVLQGIKADASDTKAWGDLKGTLFPMFRGGVSLGVAF